MHEFPYDRRPSSMRAALIGAIANRVNLHTTRKRMAPIAPLNLRSRSTTQWRPINGNGSSNGGLGEICENLSC